MSEAIRLLENELDRVRRQAIRDNESAYRNGLHDGVRIEIHVAAIEGNENKLSEENLVAIRKDIKRQLDFKRMPI